MRLLPGSLPAEGREEAGGQCETGGRAFHQRDQLVEGSAPGVPRDEVGLGEQWELLLLLHELWVLEPAMRWTTGFWAKSTPARQGKGRVNGAGGGTAGGTVQRASIQPQTAQQRGSVQNHAGLWHQWPPGSREGFPGTCSGRLVLYRRQRSQMASTPLEEKQL